jgi:FtsZ-binding cell division protein ZapB
MNPRTVILVSSGLLALLSVTVTMLGNDVAELRKKHNKLCDDHNELVRQHNNLCGIVDRNAEKTEVFYQAGRAYLQQVRG